MSDIKVTSKISLTNLLTNIVAALVFGLLIWYVNNDTKHFYIKTFFSVLFGALAFKYCLEIFQTDAIRISSDKLEVKSILGFKKPTIYFSDITFWTEITTWMPKTSTLILFTNKRKYSLDEDKYENYYELLEALPLDKPRNLEKENSIYDRINAKNILFFSGGGLFFLIICTYGAFVSKEYPWSLFHNPILWLAIGGFILFNSYSVYLYLQNPTKKFGKEYRDGSRMNENNSR